MTTARFFGCPTTGGDSRRNPEEEGVSAAEVIWTPAPTRREIRPNSYKVSCGLHGVGDVGRQRAVGLGWKLRIWRRRQGAVSRAFLRAGSPVEASEGRGRRGRPHWDGGAVSRLHLHFLEPRLLVSRRLENRLRELAFLNSGVTIRWTDERRAPSRSCPRCITRGGGGRFVPLSRPAQDAAHRAARSHITSASGDGRHRGCRDVVERQRQRMVLPFTNNIHQLRRRAAQSTGRGPGVARTVWIYSHPSRRGQSVGHFAVDRRRSTSRATMLGRVLFLRAVASKGARPKVSLFADEGQLVSW